MLCTAWPVPRRVARLPASRTGAVPVKGNLEAGSRLRFRDHDARFGLQVKREIQVDCVQSPGGRRLLRELCLKSFAKLSGDRCNAPPELVTSWGEALGKGCAGEITL